MCNLSEKAYLSEGYLLHIGGVLRVFIRTLKIHDWGNIPCRDQFGTNLGQKSIEHDQHLDFKIGKQHILSWVDGMGLALAIPHWTRPYQVFATIWTMVISLKTVTSAGFSQV